MDDCKLRVSRHCSGALSVSREDNSRFKIANITTFSLLLLLSLCFFFFFFFNFFPSCLFSQSRNLRIACLPFFVEWKSAHGPVVRIKSNLLEHLFQNTWQTVGHKATIKLFSVFIWVCIRRKQQKGEFAINSARGRLTRSLLFGSRSGWIGRIHSGYFRCNTELDMCKGSWNDQVIVHHSVDLLGEVRIPLKSSNTYFQLNVHIEVHTHIHFEL